MVEHAVVLPTRSLRWAAATDGVQLREKAWVVGPGAEPLVGVSDAGARDEVLRAAGVERRLARCVGRDLGASACFGAGGGGAPVVARCPLGPRLCDRSQPIRVPAPHAVRRSILARAVADSAEVVGGGADLGLLLKMPHEPLPPALPPLVACLAAVLWVALDKVLVEPALAAHGRVPLAAVRNRAPSHAHVVAVRLKEILARHVRARLLVAVPRQGSEREG